MDHAEINAEAVERWIEDGWQWGVPITHEEYLKAKNDVWLMLLTPTKPVPKGWFSDLSGKRVLGLASGGRRMPLYAALGSVFYWRVRKGDTLNAGFSKALGRRLWKGRFTSRNVNTIQKVFARMQSIAR